MIWKKKLIYWSGILLFLAICIVLYNSYLVWEKTKIKEQNLKVLQNPNSDPKKINQAFWDLVSADVKDFSNLNLKKIDASYFKFDGFNFYGADLYAAKFHSITIVNCDFRKANLSYAKLQNAKISNSKFNETDMTFANLERAKADEIEFVGATLKDVNFEMASLKGANFTDCDMLEARFIHANLNEAKFINASLVFAYLSTKITVEQICQCKNIEWVGGQNEEFWKQVQQKEPKLMEWWKFWRKSTEHMFRIDPEYQKAVKEYEKYKKK